MAMLRYDDVVRQLGEFGRYQKRIYFLLCLPGATHGIRMVLSVFLLFTPKHRFAIMASWSVDVTQNRCAIPGYANDTYRVQSPLHAAAIKRYVPLTAEGEPDSCLLFAGDTNLTSYDDDNRPINASTTSCQRWVFDTSVMDSTAASDMQLVCGDALKTSHATMIYMFGYLVGVFVLGIVSDWLGRKKSLCMSVVMLASSGLLLAATNNYYLFVVVNFLTGAATAAVWTSAFVIGMELVGPNKRVYTGIIIMFFFAGGLLALGGLAWGVRGWRILDIIVTSPVLLYLTYWWLVPESPRWLLQKQRVVEAQQIIDKAAEVNGVPAPDLKPAVDAQHEEHVTGCRDNRRNNSDGSRLWIVLEFCSSTLLLGRTFVVCFNWFVVSLVYYALSLNVGNLGVGGLHLNFLLSSLVEVPAYGLCLLLLDRLGRRRLHCAVMLTAGLGCAATLFPLFLLDTDHQEVTVALAMVGKMGAAAAFATVYVYSSELFPTVLRNAGMGTASVCARVGGMIAPYIADGGRVMGGVMGRAFPLIVCGSLAVTAGLLALLLPETRGQDMPDTVQDVIQMDTQADSRGVGSADGVDSYEKNHLELTAMPFTT